jgi:acetyl esterase/lipase
MNDMKQITRTDFVTTHPLDPQDAAVIAPMRAAAIVRKGRVRGIEGREPFDHFMESVLPRDDLTFENDTIGGVPGIWVQPPYYRPDQAILHLHAGWFTWGTAKAFRHLAGHLAARAGARVFVPEYRLAPEHPFPAAVDDVDACYRGFDERHIGRIAITGDSAGGNLALGVASRVATGSLSAKARLVGVASFSPVTDLTLSSTTYESRAVAEPYFTREQVACLVGAYLRGADPNDPRASPLQANLSGLPPIRIQVGDDEVLLDDSRRYIERAVAAGVDAHLDIWLGMAHGFNGDIGRLRASALAMDAMGLFLSERLKAG